MFGMQFGMLPERESFVRYRDRLQSRDAYKRATEIDEKVIADLGIAAPQPIPAEPA
jgi:glutathione S-transferase